MHYLMRKGFDRVWLPLLALLMLWALPLVGIEFSEESKKQIEIVVVGFIAYAFAHIATRGVREKKDDD